VFWDDGEIKRLDVSSREVAKIPFRVKTQKRIAEVVRPKQKVFSERFDVKMLRHVTVSPAADRVAYVALGQIWVKELPGGAPRRLTREKSRFEMFPSFTRDGSSIVYATWSDEALGDIRIVPVRGGPSRVLTKKPGHYIRPVPSPDGTHVVYERVAGGYLRDPRYGSDTGVFRLNVADGAEAQITSDGYMPHYGARSDRLYFLRASGDETGDTRTLVSFDFIERKERVLYTSGAAQAYLVSPDSQWLAFRERFKVFLTPFVETGRAVKVGPKTNGIPVSAVAKNSGDYLSWSGASDALYWASGPELFTRPLTDAFAFLKGAPEELPEPVTRGVPIGFEARADKPDGVVALSGARIITMNGNEVIENGVVVTRDNTIAAVGAVDSVKIPKGAIVIDVSGKTIIPGLIDAHAHGAQATAEIIPQSNWQHYANLAFGVTTIHDPSHQTDTIFSVSELQRAGRIRSPRTYSTGKIIYGAAGADYKAEIESLDDAFFHLNRMKAVGGFSIKSYNQPRRDQRQMVMEAARQLEMQVMPEGGATFMHNMTMLVDGHTTIEHNIPLETLYDDVLQLWKTSDVASTPTLVVAYGGIMGENYWYNKMDVWKHERLKTFVPHYVLFPRSRRREKAPEGDYNHIRAAKNLKTLVDMGRLVNTGAHGQLAGLAEHWEIWMFEQGGMTPLEALRGATLNPARTLGMDAELGSLEAGKLADLVVLDKNPLESIRNTDSVRMVMLNGRLFDAATMDQIAPAKDTLGSEAFAGRSGIGTWYGLGTLGTHADTMCSCGAGAHN
ncbi:MAG: amidohydrolase family protein, partial [Myxococcota bacterium]